MTIAEAEMIERAAPELEGIKTPLLTHSSEQAFKTCPRKYWLQYVKGLRPKHNSDALRIGSAFHMGLELLKGGTSIGDTQEAIRNAYADADCPPWMESDKFEVECETAVAMVTGWHRRWANDMILDYVAVEQVFNLPIVNPATGAATPSFRSGGKIDGIARLPDGRLSVVEHKTTGEALEADSDYWKRLLMDGQVSRYMLAARASGYDVACTVYDVTRKPSIRPKAVSKLDRGAATAKGDYFGLELHAACPERETAAMYAHRLMADMETRPEFYFCRMEIVRLENDLDEYRAEEWSVQRSIQSAKLDERRWGAAAWPRNTGACLHPYRCQFLDICRGLTGNPNETIPEGFVRADSLHPELTGSGL